MLGDLLSALSHKVNGLRGRLAGAWRLHAAWGRLELPLRAWPLSPSQAMALAWVCTSWGLPDIALTLLIQFDGVLRTGEAFMATKADFRWNGRNSAFLSLHRTKGSSRKGSPEGVSLESPLVLALLYDWFFVQKRPQLLEHSPAQFRYYFSESVRECHLEGHFRPYSLRRGGATAHFIAGGSLDRTAERGRWGNLRTARVYINTSLSDRAQQEQSESCNSRVAHFAHAMRARMLRIRRQGMRGGEPRGSAL